MSVTILILPGRKDLLPAGLMFWRVVVFLMRAMAGECPAMNFPRGNLADKLQICKFVALPQWHSQTHHAKLSDIGLASDSQGAKTSSQGQERSGISKLHFMI
jgi:hypothetical protein